MPRRGKVVRRQPPPDPKFQSRGLQKFINRLMTRGKKSVAEGIVFRAMDLIEQRLRRQPLEVFDTAVRNAMPVLEVKPRRVGGATYQVPVEIRGERRLALAQRWLITAARGRAGKSMAEKLAAELMDAAQGTGVTIKKRDDTHRMAEANKAFAHYRW
ncbi:MAG: 30S ribosomal protein S7 [Chloroflexi bacterium]|nr:30S ribosomal protein S7 [Chloroflexota bacterium]